MSVDGMTVERKTVELLDLHPAQADLEQLVRQGMMKTPRQLPAWLLYDTEGSRLWLAAWAAGKGAVWPPRCRRSGGVFGFRQRITALAAAGHR